MPSSPTLPAASFTTRLAAFAADLMGKFATSLHFNPEDQLKAPMLTLMKGTAEALGLTVEVLTVCVAAGFPVLAADRSGHAARFGGNTRPIVPATAGRCG